MTDALIERVMRANANRKDAVYYEAVHQELAPFARALESELKDMERKLDHLLAHCGNGECDVCSVIICKHGEPLHFHHDGCPACYYDELRKEADAEIERTALAARDKRE